MTIEQKYNQFVDEYWKDVEDIKRQNKRIGDILSQFGAPLTKREWLDRELETAIENEEYGYCNELKNEIQNL